jgi:hypothetical protein
MAKLTLSVQKNVISRARRYARGQGTSISRLVETYLTAVTAPSALQPEDTPVLGLLRGSLKRADLADYRRHLAAKYR